MNIPLDAFQDTAPISGTRQSRSRPRNGPRRSLVLSDPQQSPALLPLRCDQFSWNMCWESLWKNDLIARKPGRVGVERGKRGCVQRSAQGQEALAEGLQRWEWVHIITSNLTTLIILLKATVSRRWHRWRTTTRASSRRAATFRWGWLASTGLMSACAGICV